MSALDAIKTGVSGATPGAESGGPGGDAWGRMGTQGCEWHGRNLLRSSASQAAAARAALGARGERALRPASGTSHLGLRMTLCLRQPGAGLVRGDGASSPQDVGPQPPTTHAVLHLPAPSCTFPHPTAELTLTSLGSGGTREPASAQDPTSRAPRAPVLASFRLSVGLFPNRSLVWHYVWNRRCFKNWF